MNGPTISINLPSLLVIITPPLSKCKGVPIKRVSSFAYRMLVHDYLPHVGWGKGGMWGTFWEGYVTNLEAGHRKIPVWL